MESFNNNLQGGKKLVKSLEKQAVCIHPAAHPTWLGWADFSDCPAPTQLFA